MLRLEAWLGRKGVLFRRRGSPDPFDSHGYKLYRCDLDALLEGFDAAGSVDEAELVRGVLRDLDERDAEKAHERLSVLLAARGDRLSPPLRKQVESLGTALSTQLSIQKEYRRWFRESADAILAGLKVEGREDDAELLYDSLRECSGTSEYWYDLADCLKRIRDDASRPFSAPLRAGLETFLRKVRIN